MADMIRDISDTVMAIDPERDPNNDPRQHLGMYPYYLELRQDIYLIRYEVMKQRKRALRRLIADDLRKEDEELRKIGKAYMRAHP